ncbi:MAG: hypothetical protein ACR2QO_02240, partial [Acidimicrobiales bacterium]
TVTVGARTESLPVGSDGTSDSSCPGVSAVQVIVADDFAEAVTTDFRWYDNFDGRDLSNFDHRAAAGQGRGTRLFSPTGRWYGASCDGYLAFLPEGGPAISIPGLIQEAIDSITPAEPVLAVTPAHGKHVVNMQSWLAVDPVYWNQPRVATARAGRVEVTATLTPDRTLWDMGNSEVQDCVGRVDGPGVVWRAGMDDSLSTCSYTYEHPSINPPRNEFELTGTVFFEIGVATNAPGTYGPFTPIEVSTTEDIQVLEIQAVESR